MPASPDHFATVTKLENQARTSAVRSPRDFIRKLFLFLFIPFVAFELWIIFSPLNLYTFRSWEAISPFLLDFYGPFYPNQHLSMIEVGELGSRTEFSIPKPVVFITDAYGYRFDASTAPSENFAMVIVGDSMTAGSSLTQSDTIAAVLSNELQESVYPLAPASIDTLLQDERFGMGLPKVVILQLVERNISASLCPATLELNPRPRYFMDSTDFLSQLRITLDRSLRERGYLGNYLTARRQEKVVIVNEYGMVFFEESIESPSIESIPEIVTSLSRCHRWFAEQGVGFIFLPVPDRETIYFDAIPDNYRQIGITYTERSQFLRQLIQELTLNNVPIVDTLSAYEAARGAGINPYHLDDTHWNVTGVRLAVDLLLEVLPRDSIGQ